MVLNSSKTHSCWLKNRLQHFQERRQQDGPAKWPCQWNRAGYHKFFDLIQCIPNWSMVTFGGCLSDVTTVIHYHDQLFPVLSDQALPPSVQIRSDFPWHSVSLTGSKNFRAASSPSCNFDENILKLPASAARQANGNTKDNCKGLTSRFQTLQFQVMTWSKSHW